MQVYWATETAGNVCIVRTFLLVLCIVLSNVALVFSSGNVLVHELEMSFYLITGPQLDLFYSVSSSFKTCLRTLLWRIPAICTNHLNLFLLTAVVTLDINKTTINHGNYWQIHEVTHLDKGHNFLQLRPYTWKYTYGRCYIYFRSLVHTFTTSF